MPARQLQPGRYVFAASHEGMFGGRDFAYLRVVRPGEPVTAMALRRNTDVPAVADAVPPVAAALLAFAFALLLLRSLMRGAAGQKALWALGFALFAVAAASEAAAQRAGWNPTLFRLYYLAGGVLTVAYLGAGSAWMLLPRRGRDLLVGGLAVATVGRGTRSCLRRLTSTASPQPTADSRRRTACSAATRSSGPLS